MRVIARHATIRQVPDPAHFCTWVHEIATAKGAEGWAAPAGDDVQVWFEGTTPVVEAMLEWCTSIHEGASDGLVVSVQRPVLAGGFDILEAAPTP